MTLQKTPLMSFPVINQSRIPYRLQGTRATVWHTGHSLTPLSDSLKPLERQKNSAIPLWVGWLSEIISSSWPSRQSVWPRHNVISSSLVGEHGSGNAITACLPSPSSLSLAANNRHYSQAQDQQIAWNPALPSPGRGRQFFFIRGQPAARRYSDHGLPRAATSYTEHGARDICT